jgi:hypothetical protein
MASSISELIKYRSLVFEFVLSNEASPQTDEVYGVGG